MLGQGAGHSTWWVSLWQPTSVWQSVTNGYVQVSILQKRPATKRLLDRHFGCGGGKQGWVDGGKTAHRIESKDCGRRGCLHHR
jgi:hypothetical protein